MRYILVYMIDRQLFAIKDSWDGRFVTMGLDHGIAVLETMLLNSEENALLYVGTVPAFPEEVAL